MNHSCSPCKVHVLSAKVRRYRRYYATHGRGTCAYRRSTCALPDPKPAVKEVHVQKTQRHLLGNNGGKLAIAVFTKQFRTATKQLQC